MNYWKYSSITIGTNDPLMNIRTSSEYQIVISFAVIEEDISYQ